MKNIHALALAFSALTTLTACGDGDSGSGTLNGASNYRSSAEGTRETEGPNKGQCDPYSKPLAAVVRCKVNRYGRLAWVVVADDPDGRVRAQMAHDPTQSD